MMKHLQMNQISILNNLQGGGKPLNNLTKSIDNETISHRTNKFAERTFFMYLLDYIGNHTVHE